MAGTERIVVQPNWAAPVVEALAWLTDVHTSRNGTESRVALRDAPRRTVRYSAALAGDDLHRLDADAWGARGVPLDVPNWQDSARLRLAAPAGATMLALVDASNRDLVEGRRVVLIAPGVASEVQTITLVVGNALTVGPLASSWPAGTRVVPMRAGYLSSLQVSHITAGVSTLELEFELVDLAPLPTGSAPPSYRGLDLDTRRPDRSSPVPVTLSRVVERVDSETGVWEDDDQYRRPVSQRTLEYVLTSRADVAAYRAWLRRRQGRAVACWQPTWQSDLRVVADVVAGALTLTVAAVAYMDRYALRQGRRDIALWHRPTRTLVTRRILSAAVFGATEVIDLDAAMPLAGAADDWLVSWLEIVRLDSDDVEIAWTVPELARIAVGVREIVVPEPPEDLPTQYLMTESSETITTESGDPLMVEV